MSKKKKVSEAEKAGKSLLRAKIILLAFAVITIFSLTYVLFLNIKTKYFNTADDGVSVNTASSDSTGAFKDMLSDTIDEEVLWYEPTYDSVWLHLPSSPTGIAVPNTNDVSSDASTMAVYYDGFYIFLTTPALTIDTQISRVSEWLDLSKDKAFVNEEASGYYNGYKWDCTYVSYREEKPFEMFSFVNGPATIIIGTYETDRVMDAYRFAFEMLKTYYYADESMAVEDPSIAEQEEREWEEYKARMDAQAAEQEQNKELTGDDVVDYGTIINPTYKRILNFDEMFIDPKDTYVVFSFDNANAEFDEVKLRHVETDQYIYPEYVIFRSEEEGFMNHMYVDLSLYVRQGEWEFIATTYDKLLYVEYGTGNSDEVAAYNEYGVDYLSVEHHFDENGEE